jgi:hypothetical protein
MTGMTTPLSLTQIAHLHLMVSSQITLDEDEQRQGQLCDWLMDTAWMVCRIGKGMPCKLRVT